MPKAPLKLLFWQGLVASMRLNPAASPLLTSPSSSILNSWSFLLPKTCFLHLWSLCKELFWPRFFLFFKSEWSRFWESKWRCQLLLRDRLRFLPGRDPCRALLPQSPLLSSSLQPVDIGPPRVSLGPAVAPVLLLLFLSTLALGCFSTPAHLYAGLLDEMLNYFHSN